jgi:transcription antitermination factor NusB
MSRREAREAAFAFLYQLNFRQEPVSEQKALYLEVHPLDDEDLPYFNQITDGVFEKKDELDAEYSKYLKDWKQSRLPKVDIMLLRIAVYEMQYVEDIPLSVSINEAVVLAKKYSSEESKGYINAILGRISKDLEK